MERSDDEFDLPTIIEKEPIEAVEENLTQIVISNTELNQIIENNQNHLNNIIDVQVSDIQKHITSTDNADIETKSTNENISDNVKDFELKSTSERVLTQGDVSNGESVFNLDDFLNSKQTTILESSAKPQMSTNDAENTSISTPSSTTTANDSESYNLCDFSIESEPSLITQYITPTFETTNESPIQQESDSSISCTDDQIGNKLFYNVKDQSKENGNEMVCDSESFEG